MRKKKTIRPPKNLIEEWPEVFEHIYMNSMPIWYVHGVELKFKDGRIWEVDITEQLPFNNEKDIVAKLMSALKEVSKEVEQVNFNINVKKLKEEINDQTKNIMKD